MEFSCLNCYFSFLNENLGCKNGIFVPKRFWTNCKLLIVFFTPKRCYIDKLLHRGCQREEAWKRAFCWWHYFCSRTSFRGWKSRLKKSVRSHGIFFHTKIRVSAVRFAVAVRSAVRIAVGRQICRGNLPSEFEVRDPYPWGIMWI